MSEFFSSIVALVISKAGKHFAIQAHIINSEIMFSLIFDSVRSRPSAILLNKSFRKALASINTGGVSLGEYEPYQTTCNGADGLLQ